MIVQEHNQRVEEDILFIPLVIALLILSIGWVTLFANFFSVGGVSSNPTLQFGSWAHYQDNDYSQGIAYIEVYDNSTGSFKLQENLTNTESGCQVNASASVQLIIGYVANRTQLGWDVTDNSLGRNFLKFNVTVTLRNGTEVFTQQNGTYASNRYIGNALYVFEFNVILNFVTEYYAIYDVVINYDNYYGWGFYKNYLYYNDMSNDTWVDVDDCDIDSNGDQFSMNKTAGASFYVREDDCDFSFTNSTYLQVSVTNIEGNSRFRVWLYNGSGVVYDVVDETTTGIYTVLLSGIGQTDINQFRFYVTGDSGVSKNGTVDYFYLFTWEKTINGYQNDMGSTAFVDEDYYCAVTTTGSVVKMEDDEAGHDWATVRDWIRPLDLRFFSDLWVESLDGYDPNWVSWTVRFWWENGTAYNVIAQNTTFGATVLDVVQFCDSENTIIIGIDLIFNGVDNVGSAASWNYLHLRSNITEAWHTQQVEIVLTGEVFMGMLLSGISLIGLCMIPLGTITGALMVKSKQMTEDNFLLPLMIILLGFAFFIGGLAG